MACFRGCSTTRKAQQGATLIVEALVNALPDSCQEEIRRLLDTDGKAAAAVDAEIVNRVCDAIDILKQVHETCRVGYIRIGSSGQAC